MRYINKSWFFIYKCFIGKLDLSGAKYLIANQRQGRLTKKIKKINVAITFNLNNDIYVTKFYEQMQIFPRNVFYLLTHATYGLETMMN